MLSTGVCGNAVDHRAPYFGVRFTPNHIHAQQGLAQDDVVRYLNSFPEIQATTVFVLDGGPFSQCKSADGRHEAGEDFRKTWRFARADRCGTMWDGVRGMTIRKKRRRAEFPGRLAMPRHSMNRTIGCPLAWQRRRPSARTRHLRQWTNQPKRVPSRLARRRPKLPARAPKELTRDFASGV